jgi:hypothetical protein
MAKATRKTNSTGSARNGENKIAPQRNRPTREAAEKSTEKHPITPMDIPTDDPGSIEEETLAPSAPFNKTYGGQRAGVPAKPGRQRGDDPRAK